MEEQDIEQAPAAETATDTAPPAKPAPSRWARWLGNFVFGGSVIVIGIGLLALTLARYDIISKLAGFGTFMAMLIPAGVIAVVSVIALIVARRGNASSVKAATGLALSVALVGVMYFAVIAPATSAPPLHDITTNVDNPPQFATLELREDNLVPFASMEEWRAAHRVGYPDIAPILIEKSPAEVLANARALAERKGWTIASVDDATGQMEATAYAGYLRFRDDVIVKVTPVADGSSRVDMRSTSRVGVSDLGYNAARVREFLSELQAA